MGARDFTWVDPRPLPGKCPPYCPVSLAPFVVFCKFKACLINVPGIDIKELIF